MIRWNKYDDGALNATIFLKFLRRLIKDTTQKLFVIVDNLRVHKARTVMAWVEENKDRIELFYLPPYAPERNPDEYVNNDVKQGMGRRSTPMDKAAMKASLTSHSPMVRGEYSSTTALPPIS